VGLRACTLIFARTKVSVLLGRQSLPLFLPFPEERWWKGVIFMKIIYLVCCGLDA
jgi:hypothetical protein